MSLSSWEDLRKLARQLENDIDVKLVSLNKLGVSRTKHSSLSPRYDNSETASLLSNNTTLQSLCSEVEELLKKLTEINDSMSDLVTKFNASAVSNPAMFHTLQRHRDILHDYSHEFMKTRSNLQARMEREALLGSNDNEMDNSYYSAGGVNNRSKSDLFLKENEYIKSSDKMMDEQITLVMHVKENLQNQHFGLRDISRKISVLAKKYPALNSLMQKIHVKKRRDTVVLGTVIAVCLFLLFIYSTR